MEQGPEGIPSPITDEEIKVEKANIPNMDKAKEVAKQMSPQAIMAQNLRNRAHEISGMTDVDEIRQSGHPLAITLLEQADGLDREANEMGDLAESNYEQRQAVIAEETAKVFQEIVRATTRLMHGEEKFGHIMFDAPVEKLKNIGLDEKTIRNEYREAILSAIGTDPAQANKAIASFNKNKIPSFVDTSVPDVYFRYGKHGGPFSVSSEVEESLMVCKKFDVPGSILPAKAPKEEIAPETTEVQQEQS